MNEPQKNRTATEAGSHYLGLGLAMSIPFMLASGPIIGWFIGRWLDTQFGTHWLTLTMLALGFVAGVRSVIRTLREDLYVPPAFDDRTDDTRASDTAPGGEKARFGTSNAREDAGARRDSPQVDALEVDGLVVGTVSYSSQNRASEQPFTSSTIGSADSVETVQPQPVDGSTNHSTSGDGLVNNGVSGHERACTRPNMLSLPNIIASGMWITALLAGVVAVLVNGEKALGLLAGGLWNLVNFATLWLTFKTALSKHPMRSFFTLPLVCIKIPLLYTLVVALYALKLFDPLGLTLGLLVLPAVVLFLVILSNRN